MKPIISVFGSALLLAPLANAELLITGVFDGPLTGGLPKGVELYSDIDIADLSRYGLGGANNGGGSDGQEFTFPQVAINAGEYLYIASEAEGFSEFIGFAPDYTSFAMNINGDDAIELFKDDIVIDTFGDIHIDGTGTEWEYMDGWAYRVQPNSNTNTTLFTLSDWVFSGPNALDGAMSNTTAAAPIPIATFAEGVDDNPPIDNPPIDNPTIEPPTITFISTIQGDPSTQGSNTFGDTDVSPLIDQQVTVEAIVVGDFQDNDIDEQRNLRGFYLQEEDHDSDQNPLSSEGIFVFAPSLNTDVQLGDKIQISGTVGQYFGETQLSDVSQVIIIDNNRLDDITPAHIVLHPDYLTTIGGDGNYQPDLEAYEGMLVTFDQTLTITEQFQLDRFNEIKLVAGERPYQYTQLNAPDPAGFMQAQQALGAVRITYDDGLNTQNANIGLLDGFNNYQEQVAPRMGDTITGLTGVLDYKWAGNSASQSTWRVRAHQNNVNIFTSTEVGNSPNPRPATFEAPNGNLKVASLNVLNFFTTLDNGATTAAGHSPRGADSEEEFNRQLQKLTLAITAMDADILGLVEIENEFDAANDSSTAIEVLVNALNQALGNEVYDYVYPNSQFVGSDAIAVAFIYKPSTVTLAPGATALLDDAVAATLPSFSDHDFNLEPIFNGEATNRVSLAASFTHLASSQVITIAANHFKSKGSSGLSDEQSLNFDQSDGAGFWNHRRTLAAKAVNEWLASDPTGITTSNRIILGDLNAYAKEQPVQWLLDNGYRNVESEFAYSYVFDGQVGTLDYLLVSDELWQALTQASVWHINADEADALDYNLDFGKSDAYFDGSSPTRHSDHDPVVAGFYFDKQQYQPLAELVTTAIHNQTLHGLGKRPLKQWLNLLKLTLLAHKADLLVQRDQDKSCSSLYKFAERLDGDNTPIDWAKGAAASDIHRTTLDNQRLLNCHQ